MSEPDKNAQSRTSPPRKRGKGSGSLIVLILLALMGVGVFFFFKSREAEIANNNTDANAQLPELPPLSSLNLPQPKPAEENKPIEAKKDNPSEQNASSPENTLSQTQPFNYSQPLTEPTKAPEPAKVSEPIKTPKPLTKPIENKPKPIQANQKTKPAQINNYQSSKPKPSTFILVKSGYSNLRAESFAPSKKINANLIVPKQGLIPNSIASFIAYPEAHALAVKPDQIITFQTKLLPKSEAINYATSRLNSLGFNKIKIPIDDYARGGSTVIEAINERNNQQAYFSFKPFYQSAQGTTAWKLELY